jgi:hypothetical protein
VYLTMRCPRPKIVVGLKSKLHEPMTAVSLALVITSPASLHGACQASKISRGNAPPKSAVFRGDSPKQSILSRQHWNKFYEALDFYEISDRN